MTLNHQDFWSRRKAKVAEEAAVEAKEATQPAPDLTDEEILVSLDLPDPDTLKFGDDIKGFMSKAVPDHLRRKALRRLWRLNPVLANVDGLVDYGDDFTDSATVIEGMQTAYQVGKGMYAHVQEMARKVETLIEDDVTDEEEVVLTEMEDTAHVEVAEAESTTQPEPEIGIEPRKRMRFSYNDKVTEAMPT